MWFGETLDPDVLTEVEKELDMCDLCLVVGAGLVAEAGTSRGVKPKGGASWVQEMPLCFPRGAVSPRGLF